MKYSRGSSRFQLNKRTVENKDFGPLIKTVMNRCIHCTRCIRFAEEIAGVYEMGLLGRGEETEVSSAIAGMIGSELSGNLIDICPVGALTNKPYAFHARSWELKKTPSIDVMDALGSHIRIDTRGPELMRILPRSCPEINGDWISDRSRFSYDGLKYQRLDRPYIRVDGKLKPCTFEEAIQEIIKQNLDDMSVVAGDFADQESLYLAKQLFPKANFVSNDRGLQYITSDRSHYLFNHKIVNIENSDFCLLVGSNPRLEAAVLNVNLRLAVTRGMQVALLGPKYELNYPYQYLGNNLNTLDLDLGKYKYPMLVVGENVLARPDRMAILTKLSKIMQSNPRCSWNILHTRASSVGALDLGYHDSWQDKKVLYLLGADNIDPAVMRKHFVIYQGHHGDKGAQNADVILPGAAYTEKNATYVNIEGKAQQTIAALATPGEAIEDWKILIALAKALKHEAANFDLVAIREAIKTPESSPWQELRINTHAAISSDPLSPVLENFYLNDVISRHSKIMAQCSAAKEKTNGRAA